MTINKFSLVLIFLSILLIYLGLKYYPCLSLKFSSLPAEIMVKEQGPPEMIIFLYGSVCANCPSGDFIYSLRERSDVLIIVPDGFSLGDIDNLRTTFSLKSQIIKGGRGAKHFLEKWMKCKRINENTNYVIFIKNKRVSSIRGF